MNSLPLSRVHNQNCKHGPYRHDGWHKLTADFRAATLLNTCVVNLERGSKRNNTLLLGTHTTTSVQEIAAVEFLARPKPSEVTKNNTVST